MGDTNPTGVERELIVADPHLEAAGQDVNRLLLPVMNMQRRPPWGATSTTKQSKAPPA